MKAVARYSCDDMNGMLQHGQRGIVQPGKCSGSCGHQICGTPCYTRMLWE